MTRQLASQLTNKNSDRDTAERGETPYCGRLFGSLTSLFHTHSLPKRLSHTHDNSKYFFKKIYEK